MTLLSIYFFPLWIACKVDVEGAITSDLDGDGQSVLDGDCNDDDAAAFLGAAEIPYDGKDQNCDGVDLVDVDLDGHAGIPAGGTDCDDEQAGVNPEAADTWYDGVDTNCDGADDFDQDLDSYVADFYVDQPTTYVTASGALPGGDCDDEDATRNPGLEDVWYDGLDADCSGGSDYDRDADGFESDAYGGVDCNDLDEFVNPAEAEVSGDGKDNNCLNDAPVVDSIELSPREIYTDTLLFAIPELSDADGDVASPRYAWYIDGVLSEQTGEVLASSSFSVGQAIYVRVTPTDGEAEGAAVSSDLITVLNSPPQIDEVTIVPAGARVTDTLSVNIVARDPDEESLTYSYRWWVDGVEVDDGATLAAPYFSKGQEVVVEVEATEGRAVSGFVASAVVTIANTPPIVQSVSWLETEIRTDDVLRTEVGTYDADGDGVSVTYGWQVDGLAVAETGASLDGAAWFKKGQSISVSVTPHDGEELGESIDSASVVVLNTLPTAPGLLLSPHNPTAGYDDMMCEVETPALDADGDAVSYAVSWWVDGVAFAGATSTTLTGDTVRSSSYSPFQTWECTVTPSDNEGAGESGSVSVAVGCDQDEDGFVAEVCGGDDCDDQDEGVNPDALDTWYDGTDSDCNGWSEYDADGDGWDSDVYGGADCDDADADQSPDANEIWYDGEDQDCAGDDDYDQDGDGEAAYGFGANDCDDTSTAAYPGAPEICGDGLDNNCDGAIEIGVPSEYATIQAAINAAADEDTICVDRGIWTENLDFGGKEISLVGTEGSQFTIIDGGRTGRVVTLDNGGGVESRIEGFTLTKGYHATCGGGIYVEDESLILQDVLITDSHTGQGGGGLCVWTDGEVEASDFWVSGSSATFGGGGIRVWEAGLTMTSGGVAECEAISGAGIDIRESDLTLTDVAITNCEASGYGGGVQATGGVLDFSDVEISGCSAVAYQGGGMSLEGGGWPLSLSMDSVLISGNQAESGGGIGLQYVTDTLSGVTVTGNEAEYGGGIHIQDGSPTILNAVISDNSAGEGGGIYLVSSDAYVTETEMIGNLATNGGGAVWSGTTEGSYEGAPMFENVLFSKNISSPGAGGALRLNSDFVVNNCEFSENEAEGGGGLAAYANNPLTADFEASVTNSIFVANIARSDGGGAIRLEGSLNISLENLSLVGNEAEGAVGGGALGLWLPSMVMRNVNISGNTSRFGGGAVAELSSPSFPIVVDLEYTNVWDNDPDDFADIEDPMGYSGNTAVNPLYQSLAGPDPLSWDLHLGETSALVNAGDPSILDPDGSISDIGAYGGDNAGDWDMDGDGWPLWWQPGAYVGTHSTEGWDCDDDDASVYPEDGCLP